MQQQKPSSSEYHDYSWWELSSLIGVLLLGVLLMSLDVEGAPFLLMMGAAYALIRDWAGFTSLRGWLNWSHSHGSTLPWPLVAVILWLFFPYAFLVYLARVIMQTVQSSRQRQLRAPLERQKRIAELEAQLGILPATEGACRVCQKPLQVGAAFCHSCGSPVAEFVACPQVCPNCATTTFADAHWCPKCGESLLV
ncbi:MAG TPA: zinc ribbon domain-containing protein [Ktedonobacterales bacterium]|nr:zinc ribbon domain-containing protein [Ktedonobacterales bacterium]